MDENIGKIYGDFKIIKKTEIKTKSRRFKYECECVICGSKKICTPYDLKRDNYKHNINNCKECVINEEMGKTYGDLTIIKYVGVKSNCYQYVAKCSICQREHTVWIKDIHKGIGISHKHCSYLLPKNETTKKLRQIWKDMINRCTNSNNEHYNSYGGRGIKCNYIYFIDFYDNMYESYIEHCKIHDIKNTTLDRINVNGNYEKNNIRWATWEIQYKNKRKTRFKATKGDIQYIGSADDISKLIPCDKSCVYEGKCKGFEIVNLGYY